MWTFKTLCWAYQLQLTFYIFFNKTNKERVALEGHLIHFLHGPVPGHLCSCPSLYLKVDTPPQLIPFGLRPQLGDGILPLIKRWREGLSLMWPESPSRGCTVTCHTHHLCATLILSPQDSKMCLPHEEWCSSPSVPGLSTTAQEAELGSGYTWQQWWTLLLISRLLRLWLSWGTCQCKAHQFSLIWKTLHLCQNFNFNAELCHCFSSLSPQHWV